MKPALLTLFVFLLSAFSTDAAEQVLDQDGHPISPGVEYYILRTTYDPTGGGLTLLKTGYSKCAVTVLQLNSQVETGIPVKFKIPDSSTQEIYTGTPLEIEFTMKPNGVESSKWIVFDDKETQKACVGIGGAEDHPGQQILSGSFSIEKYQKGYKLVFCVAGSSTCSDIGTYGNGRGFGKRMILTEQEPYDIMFMTDNFKIRTVV